MLYVTRRENKSGTYAHASSRPFSAIHIVCLVFGDFKSHTEGKSIVKVQAKNNLKLGQTSKAERETNVLCGPTVFHSNMLFRNSYFFALMSVVHVHRRVGVNILT